MMPASATIAARDPLVVDVMIESELWDRQPGAEDTVRKAFGAAVAIEYATGEVSIMLTDDAAMRSMNAQWRGIDKPTNVLSFPAAEQALTPNGPSLGDIAIAYETVAREAEAENKPFLDHLAHLVIHGYLHLRGFDHETDSDADRMENLERRILSKLAIPDPYTHRDCAD